MLQLVKEKLMQIIFTSKFNFSPYQTKNKINNNIALSQTKLFYTLYLDLFVYICRGVKVRWMANHRKGKGKVCLRKNRGVVKSLSG